MPQYEIEIVRHSYGFYDTLVEADSREEAEEIALQQAYDKEFSEETADYEIWDSRYTACLSRRINYD